MTQEDFYQKICPVADATCPVEIAPPRGSRSRSAATGRTSLDRQPFPARAVRCPVPPATIASLFFAIVFVIINESHRAAERGLTMPVGGIGLEDILLFTIAAGVIIVLGGGAFQAWRRWSDDRRIRKHLRQ